MAGKSNPANLVVPTHTTISSLQGISDHLDNLPLEACVVELTRQLLTSTSSLPTGATSPRTVLKTVIVLWLNMVARRRETIGGRALRLA